MGSECSTEEKTLVIIAEGWCTKNLKKKKNFFQASILSHKTRQIFIVIKQFDFRVRAK